MRGPRGLARARAVLTWRQEVDGINPVFVLPGIKTFGKCYPGAYLNRVNIIRVDTGCVDEYIATALIWDDETKAFGPYPTVDRSTQGVARGAILRPGHFWARIGALGNREWHMAGKHLAHTARRHARYDWTRKRVRQWYRSSSNFRTIFYR